MPRIDHRIEAGRPDDRDDVEIIRVRKKYKDAERILVDNIIINNNNTRRSGLPQFYNGILCR